MPYKPKRPCAYPGCPRLADGQYCTEHRRLTDRLYNKYERDPESAKRYGPAWRRIQNRYIKTHPLCVECVKYGKHTPAQEVHHILPLGRGGTNDESNLMSLCKYHHSSISVKAGDRWCRNA